MNIFLILKKLDLKLVKVIDTHIHADHISGLKELHKQTNCAVINGRKISIRSSYFKSKR